MSKEFVNAVSTGDNLGAEGAFKDAISAKVGDALEIFERGGNPSETETAGFFARRHDDI